MREKGNEPIETVLWLTMRGALGDTAEEVDGFYQVPARSTAVGHVILEGAVEDGSSSGGGQ